MSDVADVPTVMNRFDIRLVARRQRWMAWLVLICLTSTAGLCVFPYPLFPGTSMGHLAILIVVVFLALRLAAWIGTILMMRALCTNLVIILICGFLMLGSGFINLIVLLLENRRATRVLRQAGLHVGFAGVKDEEVIRLLSPNLCTQCGYDLTGNVSGRCPECGWVIDPPLAAPAA